MHKMERESPPIHHPPTLLHPALLAAAQHGGSPDYSHMRAVNMESKYGIVNMDNGDRNSDCNSGDISYDGMKPTISFLCKDFSKNLSSQHVRNLIFLWGKFATVKVSILFVRTIRGGRSSKTSIRYNSCIGRLSN